MSDVKTTLFTKNATIVVNKDAQYVKDHAIDDKEGNLTGFDKLQDASIFGDPSGLSLGKTKRVEFKKAEEYNVMPEKTATQETTKATAASAPEAPAKAEKEKADKKAKADAKKPEANKKLVDDYPTIGHYVAANKKEVAKALGMKEDAPLWGEDGLVNKFSQKSLAVDSIYNDDGEKATKTVKKGDYTDNSVRVDIDTKKYPPAKPKKPEEKLWYQQAWDAVGNFFNKWEIV
jgi:hypothetical protein